MFKRKNEQKLLEKENQQNIAYNAHENDDLEKTVQIIRTIIKNEYELLEK